MRSSFRDTGFDEGLLFIILIPIMVLAAAGPALFFSVLQYTPLGQIPGSKVFFSLGGILGGLIAAYILFQAIMETSQAPSDVA